MSALNSLPLPVVRLLAFFHEELSERRPGRVPQTVQLWVGCLLVILISMTFEIPFVALSLAVLFYGIQSNAFYTKFVAILFVVATVLEIGSLFLIYKWSYGEPLIRLIIAGPILMGCMFLMRTHRLGLVFFAVAIVAIYGQTFPAMPEQEFPGFYRQRIHRPRLPEASHKFDDSRISQHISQTQARNSITLGHRFYNQQIRIFFQQ